MISTSRFVFRLEPLGNITALQCRWQAMEARCTASFFQSWAWTGCLISERFATGMVFSAQQNGVDVALALFNQCPTRLARRTLYLGETGQSNWDSLYIEHNGLLGAAQTPELLVPALAFLARSGRVVLSGVDDATLAAAAETGATVRLLHSTPAPYCDLTQDDNATMAGYSANTRYQLRRSHRLYAQQGTVQVHRATTRDEALAVLGELAALHQASWTSRGKPGAFANPQFMRFHQELIARGWADDAIDLLRITAGPALIGCLYNFRHRGRALSYQSGFAYNQAAPHQKPGLTAHYLAMQYYRDQPISAYDFLAGEDRYKASLTNAVTDLHWLDLNPRWSARGVINRLRSRNNAPPRASLN